MLWPKLILAASLSGLNASDNAPTHADESPRNHQWAAGS